MCFPLKLNEILYGSGGILIVLLTLVQITPIKINPWSFIFEWLGKQMSKETITKIDSIQKDLTCIRSDLDQLREEDSRKEAQDCRYRILRFADECYLGQLHSQEHFNQILQDITKYEKYCDDHPEFPNQVAIIAIDTIKKIYQEHMVNHNFLS